MSGRTARQAITAVTVVSVISTAMVVIGFGDQPYGYYMVLRLFICGVSLYLLTGAGLILSDWQRWTLGGFAVLYNPILPVRLGEKDIWAILNVATVVLFWVVSFRGSKQSPSTSHNSESASAHDGQVHDHVKREWRAHDTQIRGVRRTRDQASERLERWQDRAYRK